MTKLSRRRLLSGMVLLTTAAAAGSLLAACSSGTPAASPATPNPTAAPKAAAAAPTTAAGAATAPTSAPTAAPAAQPAATSAPTGGKATLELWHQHPEWKDAMNVVVKTFEEKYPNITVNPTGSAQYQNQLQTALNAGTGPDLFATPSRPQLDVMSGTGQLMELRDQVDQSKWTAVAKEAVTIKGKIWGVPGGKYTVGIAYHTDLFDKAGIKGEPKTWADLTQAFTQLMEIKVFPYSIAAKDGSLTYFNYIGLASTILALDGFDQVVDGKLKLTDPSLVPVIQQMMDWGKFYEPNFVGTVYQESKALFATGKAAAMDAGSSDFNGFLQINPNAKLGFMYWPASDAQHKPCTNTGMEFIVGVNAKTKYPDQSVKFASWIGTTDGAQVMTDNVRDLPVVDGVKVKDPLQQKMLDTPLDVPVWYERFSTENLGTVWTAKGQAPFEGKMKAVDMAKLLQDSIDAQLALAAKGQN